MLVVQGIAVGIATKIPPHNLGEVVAALEALVQQPEISTRELLRCTPAPDFPTGIFWDKQTFLDALGFGGRGGSSLVSACGSC